MANRCFLFININGRVSFWEYIDGAPFPCSIHGEFSFPGHGFWEMWRRQYRLEDDELRDLLYLSDMEISGQDVPAWFYEHGAGVSVWSHAGLDRIMANVETLLSKTVVVNWHGRTTTVWHGGDPMHPLILHGVSTSEVGLNVDADEESIDSKRSIRAFLSLAEECRAQNERRCRSRR